MQEELAVRMEDLLPYEGRAPIRVGRYVLLRTGLPGRFQVTGIQGDRVYIVAKPHKIRF